MPGVVAQGWVWLRGRSAHDRSAKHPFEDLTDTFLEDSGRSSKPADPDSAAVNVKSEHRVMLSGKGGDDAPPVSSCEYARCPHRARLPPRHIQRGHRGRSVLPSHTPHLRRSSPLAPTILSFFIPAAPCRSPCLALSLLLLCLALPSAAAQNATSCGLNADLTRGSGTLLRCVCRPGFFNTTFACRYPPPPPPFPPCLPSPPQGSRVAP